MSDGRTQFYNALFGKRTTKKHKTWEEDGILEVMPSSAILRNTFGAFVGKITNIKPDFVEEGKILVIGSKEVQVLEPLESKPVYSNKEKEETENQEPVNQPPAKKVKPSQPYFNTFLPSCSVKRKFQKPSEPYDPLSMPAPPHEHQFNRNVKNRPVVEVSVDSCLAKVLRPHQRVGVKFLYERIMGYTNGDYQGAILADDMGLGKTLQCITLIWTLLKQGPYGSPELKKVLIVTPSSLAANWNSEFYKWLGMERIRTFLVDGKNKPKDFAAFNTIPVLVISYEMVVRCIEDIRRIPFDLIVCDEGHRLKNNATKAAQLLCELQCLRRIVVTGTPVQNDLSEFYSLVNFVNPGFLGSCLDFKRRYEAPVLASRNPDADEETKNLGEEAAAELNELTSCFILRRSQDVIDRFLPTKTEAVVLCKPSEYQLDVYKKTLDFWENREVLGVTLNHLSILQNLKKICNHPHLLRRPEEGEENVAESLIGQLEDQLSCSFDPSQSGKMGVLLTALGNFKLKGDRVVVVSNYTQTLDIIEKMCSSVGFKTCRLDGSTPVGHRGRIVDGFNDRKSEIFVFLLSSKAGGVGLNLIGASRLILFDSDWNPATDQQAMSRVWRDGQKKAVYIYRFLTTGTLEEKIFQRQITKTGLSGAIVDPYSSSIKLSQEELKDLFTLQTETDSVTHEALSCDCSKNGCSMQHNQLEEENDYDEEEERECQLGVDKTSKMKSRKVRINELFRWKHYGFPVETKVLEDIGLKDCNESITFLFLNESKIL